MLHRLHGNLFCISLACLAATACIGSDGGDSDDGGGRDPDAGVSDPPWELDVSGQVVDFVTGEVHQGPVDLEHGLWCLGDSLPYCAQGAATAESGSFSVGGEFTADLGLPIFVVRVASGDEELAATVADRTLECVLHSTQSCTLEGLALPVLPRDLADGWRRELAAGGMADALERGLVLLEFRTPDGAPAEGVEPAAVLDGEPVALEPGTEVRFLDADRMTLLPAATGSTGPSGLILMAPRSDLAQVSGTSEDHRWEPTGVFALPGAIFTEEARAEDRSAAALGKRRALAPAWTLPAARPVPR